MNLTIGKLAARAGVNVETIRYYERTGMIDQPARPPGGFRRYGRSELDRIRFIKKAQALGFTLDEIKTLLALSGARCTEIQSIAESRLEDVQARIQDLKQLETVLTDLVRQCRAQGDKAECPIIESLLASGRD